MAGRIVPATGGCVESQASANGFAAERFRLYGRAVSNGFPFCAEPSPTSRATGGCVASQTYADSFAAERFQLYESAVRNCADPGIRGSAAARAREHHGRQQRNQPRVHRQLRARRARGLARTALNAGALPKQPEDDWNGSFAAESETVTLASGQLFEAGHWFEPGEANTRSVVVELPAEKFGLVRVNAWAGHSRFREVPLRAQWKRDNGALAAEMSILRNGVETPYKGIAREEICATYAVRRNEASADLPLWPLPTASSAAAVSPAPR